MWYENAIVRFTTIISDNTKISNLLENLLLDAILITPLFWLIHSILIYKIFIELFLKLGNTVYKS